MHTTHGLLHQKQVLVISTVCVNTLLTPALHVAVQRPRGGPMAGAFCSVFLVVVLLVVVCPP